MTIKINSIGKTKVGPQDIQFFNNNGYFIARDFIEKPVVDNIKASANKLIKQPEQPFELEASLQYDGAPLSQNDEGGNTVRRFLQMHNRDKIYTDWLRANNITSVLSEMLSASEIALVTAHHNSLMTKLPLFSSSTNWHRDIRYWHYPEQNLVSVWMPLGREHSENGGLKIIPQSHVMHFDEACYDEKKFFRDDLPSNQEHIANAINVDISPGDVLFFHARLLHAANANSLAEPKLSLVYTFRNANNKPLAGSRSDQPDLMLLL